MQKRTRCKRNAERTFYKISECKKTRTQERRITIHNVQQYSVYIQGPTVLYDDGTYNGKKI